MSFEGVGGAAGFARGEARIALSPDGDGTRIEYHATAQVGGKLAQIGSRLVDGAAAKVTDDFFEHLVERLGGAATQVSQPAVAAAPSPGLLHSTWVRIILAAVVVLIVAIYWMSHSG